MNILDAYIKDAIKLREAEEANLSQLKARVIKAVQELENTDENGRVLTSFFNAINKHDIVSKLHENLDGRFNEKFVAQMKEIIFQALSSFNQDSVKQFLEDFNNDALIDISKLLSPRSTLSDCFSSPAAFIAFKALIPVGRRWKNKGPGEFALAALSKQISLRDAGGDLDIAGQNVEVKVNTSGGGGRMGSNATATNQSQNGIIQSFNEKYGEIIPKVNSITLKPFVKMLDTKLPVGKTTLVRNEVNQTDDKYNNNALRKEISTALIGNIFGAEIGKNIGNMIARGVDIGTISAEYISGNFKWYQHEEQFASILMLDLAADVAYNIKDAAAFKRILPYIKGGTPAIVPTGANPTETFFQLTAKA